jgi:hypothetical protein
MREDRVAFLLLFCGMVLVNRRKASLAETMSMLPLYGMGRLLAIEMAGTSLHAEAGNQTVYPLDGQT